MIPSPTESFSKEVQCHRLSPGKLFDCQGGGRGRGEGRGGEEEGGGEVRGGGGRDGGKESNCS